MSRQERFHFEKLQQISFDKKIISLNNFRKMETNLILGSIIFFLSALLQGLSGFGFSLLALPFILLLIPAQTVVPVMILYSIIINSIVLCSSRKHMKISDILPFLFGGILGLPLGIYILLVLSGSYLKILVGIVIMIFGLIILLGVKFGKNRNKFIKLPLGLLSGVLCSSISLSGPPLIIYFTGYDLKKQYFRANLAFYFLILNFITVVFYSFNNLVTKEVITTLFNYFPSLITGVILGSYLSSKITEKAFRKLVLIFLIFSGMMTIMITILDKQ